MADSSPSLSVLRRRISHIEQHRPITEGVQISTGQEGIDSAIGGGITRGCLHELFALDPDDAGSVTGFAAMLALRLGGGILWLRQEAVQKASGRLHAAGLLEIGLDPARVIVAVLPDPVSVLRAAADVVRCPDVGVAVVELWQRPPALDLTASRRLALAAEASGVTVLLLRVDAEPTPSAAQTRWAVRAAASAPLEANAPGYPTLEIELLRQRGRPAGGCWQVEWDRESAVFRPADRNADAPIRTAPPGAVVSLPRGGPDAAPSLVPLRRTG
jgi:protein ImuA